MHHSYTRPLFITLLFLLVSACAGATNWIRYDRGGKTIRNTDSFSEESGGYSGRQTTPIAGIKCLFDYCDNKELVVVSEANIQTLFNPSHWTAWFGSADNGNPTSARCPDDMLVNELQCRGPWCEDLRMGCGKIATDYRVVSSDVRYTEWFSEEDGEKRCPDGYYLWGVECKGDYCDDIKLACAKFEYDACARHYGPGSYVMSAEICVEESESDGWFDDDLEVFYFAGILTIPYRKDTALGVSPNKCWFKSYSGMGGISSAAGDDPWKVNINNLPACRSLVQTDLPIAHTGEVEDLKMRLQVWEDDNVANDYLFNHEGIFPDSATESCDATGRHFTTTVRNSDCCTESGSGCDQESKLTVKWNFDKIEQYPTVYVRRHHNNCGVFGGCDDGKCPYTHSC